MQAIQIVEAVPRDGSQNAPHVVSEADALELIRRSPPAEIRRIEVGSFVDPVRVSHMADIEVARLPVSADTVYMGKPLPALVPKVRAFPPARQD